MTIMIMKPPSFSPGASASPSPSPSPSPSSSNQDVSPPPTALTIVLSVACGAVATCILVTIVLLLLRHRSYKKPFRQGRRASASTRTRAVMPSAAVAGDKAPNNSSSSTTLALAPDTDSVVEFLPILHSKNHSARAREREPGHVLSLTYPKRAHLGLARSRSSTMSLPSYIV